jgi:hypothetical protein
MFMSPAPQGDRALFCHRPKTDFVLGIFFGTANQEEKEEVMTASLSTDEYYAEEDDLPLGIFPEAHTESCHHALKRQGLPCTRLNGELFYEMNQLERNRLVGCSTEELYDIDLWDRLSGLSVWEEPPPSWKNRLVNPGDRLDNLNRQARWEHVERFLRQVYCWCQDGRSPEIVPHSNGRGRSTWRFRQLIWTEEGIMAANSAPPEFPTTATQILHAAWNFLFWCRRRWLKAHPGKVWLSEHRLHLVRHAFRALLTHFGTPASDWPNIKEEAKPSWPTKLEAKLAELKDREGRALTRLHHLQQQRLLTQEKLRLALDFLDDLADDTDLTQSRLDGAIVKLARQNGYDEDFWGSRLDLSQLSPDELLELKEEMRAVVTEAVPPPIDDPVGGEVIFQPLAENIYIHQNPSP